MYNINDTVYAYHVQTNSIIKSKVLYKYKSNHIYTYRLEGYGYFYEYELGYDFNDLAKSIVRMYDEEIERVVEKRGEFKFNYMNMKEEI